MQSDNICECIPPDIQNFYEKNKAFLNDYYVRSFLKHPENQELLKLAISQPTKAHREALDEKFKRFYSNIRLTSYLSKTIHYQAINFDKRARSLRERFPLVADAPIGEGPDTMIDTVKDPKSEIVLDDLINKLCISDHVTCPTLFDALQSLTKNQRHIITLAYLHGLSDTEIGKLLNKSQQAVSKTHKKSLEKLLIFLKERGVRHGHVES